MTSTNSKKMKASDRQAIIRRVSSLLQKRYGRALPKEQRDVLHTLLLAILLENASHEAASAALDRLLAGFHDLNEVRVSSITEIEAVLGELPYADWKSLRIREALQFTFEKYYSFDLDVLRRKTMDIAEKQLAKIAYLTPFVRDYVLQHSLGSHVLPIDDVSREVIQWLGLASRGADNQGTSEEVRSAVRKQDAPLFCHLIRSLATDPRYAGTFSRSTAAGSNGEIAGETAVERLKQHLARPPKAAKKTLKKSHKRPPAGSSGTRNRRTGKTGVVRKRVSRPKPSGARRVGTR